MQEIVVVKAVNKSGAHSIHIMPSPRRHDMPFDPDSPVESDEETLKRAREVFESHAMHRAFGLEIEDMDIRYLSRGTWMEIQLEEAE